MLTASAASAQPSKPSGDGTIAEARARFEEGLKLGEAGDHEAARLKFNQAWALIKTSSVLYNLARAEHSSNHPVESLDHFRAFAKLPDDGKITPTMRQRANEYIAELTKKVGQIEIEAAPGARITVDGRQVDMSTGDPIVVMPGKHVVEATADGKVRSANVECGAGTIVKAKLVEETKAGPASSGAGTAAALTPEKPVTDERLKDEPSPTFWSAGRIVGTSIAALGIAGIGTGVGFHLATESAEEDIASTRDRLGPSPDTACSAAGPRPNECAELSASIENRDTRSALRAGFLIGGGAVFVGGVVLFLVSGSSKPSAKQTGAVIVPMVSAREGGLSVLGRF